MLLASDSTVTSKKDALTRLLAALQEAQKEVESDPGVALDILLKHEDQSSPLDKEIEEKSLELLLPLMTEKSAPFGAQDPASWEAVHRWLSENQLIPDSLQAKDAYTQL
ncbi:hypothetical protein D3C73_1321540 [compost metagenome]